jgi:class 3 adenylate cyclase
VSEIDEGRQRGERVRAALDSGLNAEALDIARLALEKYRDISELNYLAALACARMGAISEAEKWLAKIDREELCGNPLAVEVWSLAGRIAKERLAATPDKTHSIARELARLAIDCYSHAFDISGAAYPAINAATLSLLGGDFGLAETFAKKALESLDTTGDHWRHATAGEAHLILGASAKARDEYCAAHELAGTKYGDVASMRRQLLLIGTPAAIELLSAIPAPRVIAFSGHMIDRPGRTPPRFPLRLEAKVTTAIREKLTGLGPAVGYAQAACGSDILFLEAMQAAGMQTTVVLPFAKADFMDSSISFAGAGWVDRFERVLQRATRVVYATDEAHLGDQVLFEHAANLIHGMALLHARELESLPVLLTVREPNSVEIPGGTAAVAQAWKQKGGEVAEIDLAALRGDGRPPNGESAPSTDRSSTTAPRSLKSLLFADISGFSRLAEQHTPRFVGMFLDICKSILDELDHPPADANTRGDALFMVFDAPGHAAEYGLKLQQAARRIDWRAYGLDAGTGVRTGLHTGPVYRVHDPVMGKDTFYGTHVNRAARLEPIVQPGHIFVTEAFAASLAADDETGFRCQYIGATALAKNYGEAKLYRLARTGGF